MPDHELAVHRIIAQIYEAIGRPALWDELLGAMAELVDSPSATLGVVDGAGLLNGIPHSTGIDPGWAYSYQEHFYSCNLLVQRLIAQAKVGEVLLGTAVVQEKTLLRTEIYNDWFKPQDLHHLAGGLASKTDGLASVLGFHRPSSTEDFSSCELRTIELLLSHLKTAIRAESQMRLESLHMMLDQFVKPAFLLTRECHLLLHNASGLQLLTSADGVSVRRGGKVECAHAATQRQFQSTVRRASLADQSSVLAGSEDFVLIPRPSASSPLLAFITRTPGTLQVLDSRAAVLVLVTDPAESSTARPALLKAVWGMTSTECKVAGYLMAGDDLQQVADRLLVSRETVRTHLKNIFQKTGATRQGELISLLFKVAGQI